MVITFKINCYSKRFLPGVQGQCDFFLLNIPDVYKRQGAEGNAETELQTEAVPENTAEAVTGEEKTLNGTVDEIKDFMFIVTDDSGASYELSFDAKPQGLENVSVGDKVKVCLLYTSRE